MHLLFLTTNNLATNPRLYKELRLAIELNHTCSVVQFRLGNWSDDKSEELKEVVRDENQVVRGEKTVVRSEKEVVSDEKKEVSDEKTVVRDKSQVVRCELRGVKAKKRELEFIEIDATSKQKFSWLKWGLLEKIARWVYPRFTNNLFINALASSRRSFQITKALKDANKPDLIIAHNLGALYPAYRLSQKWHIPFIFDIEDYHPGEFIRSDSTNEQQRCEFLMKRLLPQAVAITSASPLIGQYTLKLIGGHPNHQVILNSFPQSEFNNKSNNQIINSSDNQIINSSNNQSLSLVWFSQKISFGRGLEQLFEALIQNLHSSNTQLLSSSNTQFLSSSNTQFPISSNTQLTLTLIGDLDPEFSKQIIEPFLIQLKTHNSLTLNPSSGLPSTVSLSISPPLSQPALHAELANHDIGLALEPGKDLNNNLAISNKIIAYAQAGLYILATDTPAQKAFMEEQPERGVVCGQTPEAMAEALSRIIENKQQIMQKAIARFEKGQDLAWEKEREKLSAVWEE